MAIFSNGTLIPGGELVSTSSINGVTRPDWFVDNAAEDWIPLCPDSASR